VRDGSVVAGANIGLPLGSTGEEQSAAAGVDARCRRRATSRRGRRAFSAEGERGPMETIVRELPLPVFGMMVLFLLGMSGISLFAGYKARRSAAIVEETKTSPIGFAQDGYREFEGRVEPVGDEMLTAPLTQSPCCWYHVRLEKWTHETNSRPSGWSVVREATSSSPFLVRDATGVCAVQSYGADLTPTDRSVWTGSTEVPTDRNPPRVPPTESATGAVQVSGGPGAQYRYTEERIYAGDPLLVIGSFTNGRFAASGTDDEDEEEDLDVDADEASDAEDLDPFDDGAQAARLCDRAWEITRSWVGIGRDKRPFIITTTPQAAHVAMSQMGGQAAMSIALGPLAVAALLIWTRLK
jgi:hypothetical protein